jgi:hypothetical protein
MSILASKNLMATTTKHAMTLSDYDLRTRGAANEM